MYLEVAAVRGEDGVREIVARANGRLDGEGSWLASEASAGGRDIGATHHGCVSGLRGGRALKVSREGTGQRRVQELKADKGRTGPVRCRLRSSGDRQDQVSVIWLPDHLMCAWGVYICQVPRSIYLQYHYYVLELNIVLLNTHYLYEEPSQMEDVKVLHLSICPLAAFSEGASHGKKNIFIHCFSLGARPPHFSNILSPSNIRRAKAQSCKHATSVKRVYTVRNLLIQCPSTRA